MLFYCFLDLIKNIAQCFQFCNGIAGWVIGIDAGKIQRGLFNVCAGKWLHGVKNGSLALQVAVIVIGQHDCGNFKDTVGM